MSSLLCKTSGCFASKPLVEFRGESYCLKHLAQNLEEENQTLYRNLTECQVRCNSLFLEAQDARQETKKARVHTSREIAELEKQLARKTSELAELKTPPIKSWYLSDSSDVLFDAVS